MMRIRFCLDGDIQTSYLSDIDRIVDIVDDHIREHLANIDSLTIFYNHHRKIGIVEYSCLTPEDNYAVFPRMTFDFFGVLCSVTFENGFLEEHS